MFTKAVTSETNAVFQESGEAEQWTLTGSTDGQGGFPTAASP